MAGDHACPVCQATFTRPQHVARHMRSHTGDRPYKCPVCNDSFGRSDLLKRHEKKMHSAGSSTTSTPTTAKGKFDANVSKSSLKRPQPFPYVDSGTTSVASGSGGDISASASGSGSGSGSGADSVPTQARQQHSHRPRSDSGSNSDSRSRSRSLSPLRRQEALQDQDELISSDDGGPSTTKYRRLSDPSGLSRMETDSRKSPSPSGTSSRYGRTHAPYIRHNSREAPVLTSSMHGTESVRVCRVIRNEGHHFIVEYAISAMLEGTRPNSSTRVAPVPIKDTCYVLAKTSPHVLSPELFGLHLGAHLVGTHVHVRAARIVIQQVKWGRIPVRGRLHGSTFLRDGEEKRSVTIDVRRESIAGPNDDDKEAQDVVMADVRSSIQGLVVMKTVVVRNGYARDECTNVNEHDDGVYCAQMDVEYLLGLPRVPLRIEELAALGESMRFTDVAQRVRDTSLEVFATDEEEDVQVTMHRMSREVLEQNPTVIEVTYRMPNRHYIPVPLDYIGLQNTKAREAEVFCPVDAPSGCISTTVARAVG
ncbi:unnamed protein product [Rhizoctonia solani]|uniref:factor independent urate hydroxylase n=1 Tax=Rhizoctonia solani TaxID=456999 RepID=A0A8H3A5R6_9AGAM|nr:unnamed protein product [Rhizoctonia solani]